MNVAVRVQHHASRTHLLDTLLHQLEGFDDVAVIEDPGGPRRSSWRSHRACLQALPARATHLLVVQDDALPCDGFAERAAAAIADHPDRVIAFFVPGFGNMLALMAQARKRREAFVDLSVRAFCPTVCISYPAPVAREFLEFAHRRRMPESRADDGLLASFLRANRIFPLATCPSLVEHLDGEPSAMGVRPRAGRHRTAAWYEGGLDAVHPRR